MSLLEMLAVCLAGVAAGTINAVVGSGTLITFPTLLAVGVPPVTANVSNNIGLVPGAVSGAFGYRRELVGQAPRLRRLLVASVSGGLLGAVLLLALPPDAFRTIVPLLIVTGCVLVVLQPVVGRKVAEAARTRGGQRPHGTWWVPVGVFLAGVYGGYFGAAQGIILLAVMGLGIQEHLQRLNAAKNVLAGAVNGVAAVLFVAIADVDWVVVALIATGAVVGGYLGATVGRRLPATALRVFIVLVGIAAVVGFYAG